MPKFLNFGYVYRGCSRIFLIKIDKVLFKTKVNVVMSTSPILFPSLDEGEGLHKELEVLKKFQIMLQGIPPPSSVTMPRLSVTEMLTKYKENESSFGYECQKLEFQSGNKRNFTPLVYYLNSSDTSEEIALLSQKVQSRYIYSETMSSCNIWFDSTVKTNSAKKRAKQRNGFGISPGRRLSHLARRRQIFSCENLQQLANTERRHHIEIKKPETLKSSCGDKNKAAIYEKLKSSKRALFLSPDDEESKKMSHTSNSIKRNLFPSSEKSTTAQNVCKTAEVSRWLSQQNFNVGTSRRRKKMDSKEDHGNWPRRALTFTEEDTDKILEKNSANVKAISEIQLSLHHKSKLLWAVSMTLKEKNLSSKDAHFKTIASALFMICRKNLGKILNSKAGSGTSEKMVNFARGQIDGILEKVGVNVGNRNSNITNEKPDTVGINSDVNMETKDSSRTVGEEIVLTSESMSNFSTNEDSSSSQAEKMSEGINEKENIDVCESGNCLF